MAPKQQGNDATASMLSVASTARNAALLGDYKTAKQLLEKLVQDVCEEGIGYAGQNMNQGAVDVVVRGTCVEEDAGVCECDTCDDVT